MRLGRAGVDPLSARVPASVRAIGRYGQIEWRADTPDGPVTGVETFIVRKGRVVVHALRTMGSPHHASDAPFPGTAWVGGGPPASDDRIGVYGTSGTTAADGSVATGASGAADHSVAPIRRSR